MQFEEFDYEESDKCKCQLLQNVQQLVNKYRNVIEAAADDHYENLSSSTVCGAAESSAMLKALPSPEFAPSEVSSRLSVHNGRRPGANSASSSRLRAECTDLRREDACHSPAQLVHSPVRIVRIPNRQCPVHWRIDEHYFNGTGSALELNYETISVTNCWQGLKFASPTNNGSANGSCSTKISPAATTSLWLNSARTSTCTFLEPFWSFVIVLICGSIVFLYCACSND